MGTDRGATLQTLKNGTLGEFRRVFSGRDAAGPLLLTKNQDANNFVWPLIRNVSVLMPGESTTYWPVREGFWEPGKKQVRCTRKMSVPSPTLWGGGREEGTDLEGKLSFTN